MSERTIVIGDAHGYPWIIENALEHAGFEPGVDQLVFAGDFLDRGPDLMRCLELVEDHADVVLVGNHELGVLLGYSVEPGDSRSLVFATALRSRVLDAPKPERWRCATLVGDVLVTHAGVCERSQGAFVEQCGADLALFSEWLNSTFDESLRASLDRGWVDYEGPLGDDGPLWFRPGRFGFLKGVRQVFGHTYLHPGDARVAAENGLYPIDPNVYTPPALDRYRYAVIETGDDGWPDVWVEDSEVGRIGG